MAPTRAFRSKEARILGWSLILIILAIASDMLFEVRIGLYILILAALPPIYLLFWKTYFLRDPKRVIPPGQNIVSPADGKIIRIQDFNLEESFESKKGLCGKIRSSLKDVATKGKIIAIFMSPLDVHINRAPIYGKIMKQTHKNGKFHMASDFQSLYFNEKNEILIKNSKLKIKIIQVAGFLARRIESCVREGENIEKGQKIGLINLGSQAVLILPEKVKLKVKAGEKVKAGTTIIGDYK